MESRLPDEYFRSRPEDEVKEAEQPRAKSSFRDVLKAVPVKRKLVPIRAAVVIAFSALVVGYLSGALLADATRAARHDPVPPNITSHPSPSDRPANSTTIYDGDTVPLSPIGWTTSCGTIDWMGSRGSWECEGDGVGETLTFTFEPGQSIVGVRIIGGNDATIDRFQSRRRVTSVRWRFADGSWFEQGLPSEVPLVQEVAFPLVKSGLVQIEVLASTPPGTGSDAVSISQLQFLGPA